jgi:hypothetical protein
MLLAFLKKAGVVNVTRLKKDVILEKAKAILGPKP